MMRTTGDEQISKIRQQQGTRLQSQRISVLLIFCLFFSGCGQPSRGKMQKDVGRLPGCFAVLERLQVTAYRNQDWCKNISYKRGKFSNNAKESCNYLLGGGSVAFDAQAEKDVAVLAKAISKTGVGLRIISDLEYGAEGKLKKAVFHLAGFGRYTYVYSPGYGTPPPDIPQERRHTSLNGDWYYVWEDWN